MWTAPRTATGPVLHESAQLSDAARRMIEQADTLFLATAYAGDGEARPARRAAWTSRTAAASPALCAWRPTAR